MKAKLLKKIRKKFLIVWNGKHFLVLDHKKQRVRTFGCTLSFMDHYINTYWGMWSGFEYIKKIHKRQREKMYRETLKEIGRAANGSERHEGCFKERKEPVKINKVLIIAKKKYNYDQEA